MQRKASKKKPGRKIKGRAYSVKLTNEVAEQLRKLGGGNLTRGIETAAHIERTRT
jgi:hypothetical protein